jgi:alpha-glucosidase
LREAHNLWEPSDMHHAPSRFHWRTRLWYSLLLGVCAIWPAAVRAQWSSVGRMPPPQRVEGGIEYRNDGEVVRISVIEAGIVRVRYSRGRSLPPESSYAVLPGMRRSQAAFEFSSEASADRLRTAELRVDISRDPFRIRLRDAQGQALEQDASAGMASDSDGRVQVWKSLSADAHLFGFGEKGGLLDKRGARAAGSSLVMWNTDAFAYDDTIDPLYDAIPFFMTIQNGRAHGTFFDNTWRSTFDIGRISPNLMSFGAEGGEMDYYILAGPRPADVLRRYALLTGPTPLPPLWALGYQQCRYSYYPQSRVMEIAKGFRDRKIPADGIWLDIHYMDGYRVFTWDPARFPQPRQMLAELAAMDLKTVTIVDPGVKLDPGYAVYDGGVEAGVFARKPDGQLYSGRVWPGTSVFPDFTHAPVRQWWAGHVSDFVAAGLAGIWIDMNEPAVMGVPTATMPDDVVFRRDGQPVTHAQVHNVYGQQMSLATQEGLLQRRPDQRPFVLTRATYAGGQRYAAVWTGDNVASWAHLKSGIGTLLGMGISGYPFVGSDIGGFSELGPADAELFTRWMQAGAFFPFMRAHTILEAPDKEPWAFGPEHERMNRSAIERRYEFLPYIYNCFYQSFRSGMPVMRALLVEYPDDAATYDASDEFLVGPDLLVAPVVTPRATAREVYLPRGTWYDLRTDAAHDGGKKISVEANNNEIPLFAAEGAILFRASPMQSTAEWPSAGLTFDVFARRFTEREYYEDDGASFAYLQQGYFRRTISVRPETQRVTVTLGAAEGTYSPRRARNAIALHFAHSPAGVTLNGRALPASDVHFDQARAVLTVEIPQARARQTVVVNW